MNTQTFKIKFAVILTVFLLTQLLTAQTTFRCLEFASEQSGIVAGDNGVIYRTIDGGEAWEQAVTNTTENILKTTAADGNSIVAVGTNGLILRSIDAGESWETMTSNTTADLHGVFISANGIGFAVGEAGAILRTNDHGASWSVMQENRGNDLQCISMGDENNGIIAGDNNNIFVTNDGGLTWGPPTSGFAFQLDFRFVRMTDRQTAFLTTTTGGLLKSLDGGNCWTMVYNDPTYAGFWRVNLVSNRLVSVGLQGKVIISDDLGSTWYPVESGTTNDLYCLNFANDRIGFTGGASGTMLRTEDGGMSWSPVENGIFNLNPADRLIAYRNGHPTVNIPGDLELDQNYPNPFNPSTIITYTLGSNARVDLRVYDITGREVAALVNSTQPKGSHSVNFNASGLSSGIYFCRIAVNSGTSEYSKIMKMTLIK
ncbi:MAG: T9SS type A sorting domain-containing protein [Ignavibacteria bacterium]|nr:T9SS type A sorting domain-containing protein [Ignavibacteria bacterium]